MGRKQAERPSPVHQRRGSIGGDMAKNKRAINPRQELDDPLSNQRDHSNTSIPGAINCRRPASTREARCASELLRGPQTVRDLHPISNNPAEYISRLRRKYGLVIPCERIRFTTPDGFKSWYGIYSPTDGDRERLAEIAEGNR